jgi:hypothetical protein
MMVFMALIGGLTTIVIASLGFAYAVVGRQRRDGASALLPYMLVARGSHCPHCGFQSEAERGMTQPAACSPEYRANGCVEAESHLHVQCTFCHSKWSMRTRVSVDAVEEDETR